MDTKKLQKRYMQYVTTFVACLLSTICTMTDVWSSPSLPKLTSDNSPTGITITLEEESWILANVKIGAILGCITATALSNNYGRKTLLLVAGFPTLISWIGIAFIKSTMALIIIRIFAGIPLGIVYTILPLYVGEVSHKDIRGRLSIVQHISRSLGTLLIFSVGPFISYKNLALLCSAFSAIFVVLFCFMPESPYFLVKIGNIKGAKQSLTKLSGKYADKTEIDCSLVDIQNGTVTDEIGRKPNIWNLLTIRSNRNSLLIMLAIQIVLVYSGFFTVLYYLQTILTYSGSILSPDSSSAICAVMVSLSAILAAGLVDKLGRKALYIVSSCGASVTLMIQGGYMYLQDEVKLELSHISWLPLLNLSLYLIFVTFGICVIPSVLMGELFSVDVKHYASCICCLLMYLLQFTLSKFFHSLSKKWGMYTMFWIFAGVTTLGCLFGFTVLPETKGKSLEEIQKLQLSLKKSEADEIATLVSKQKHKELLIV